MILNLDLYPEATTIIDNDQLVGLIIQNKEVSEYPLVMITLDTDLLDEQKARDLAAQANKANCKVIFYNYSDYVSAKQQHEILKRVASHSQDDVTTAVLAGEGREESTVDFLWSAVAYTYNQKLGNGVLFHAEAVLLEAFKVLEIDMAEIAPWWLMLLEPCRDCLERIVETSEAKVISYFVPHKDKWNTLEYLTLKKELETSGKIKYTLEVLE